MVYIENEYKNELDKFRYSSVIIICRFRGHNMQVWDTTCLKPAYFDDAISKYIYLVFLFIFNIYHEHKVTNFFFTLNGYAN